MIYGLDFIEKNLNGEFLENGILEITKLNNNKELSNTILTKENIIKYQEEFLKTNIIKEINNSLDIYLKEFFPDSLGENLINLKNNIINNNIKNSINKNIEIATEKNNNYIDEYDMISKIQDNVMTKENINSLSNNINENINKLEKNTNKKIIKKLDKEKIVNNIEESIDKTFEKQKNNIKKIEKYIKNWENKYNLKDIEGMKKEYNRMEKLIEDLIPLENVLNNYRKIENIQKLLENNSSENYLDEQVLELANKLK